MNQPANATSLFHGTDEMVDIVEILDRMEANCPQPSSTSKKLWKLRRKTGVAGHNPSKETLLEKGIVMLARNGHLPEWFNQCPTASGVCGSKRNRRSNVDLVHWTAADKTATLVELKWGNDSPSCAVRQILRYGAAYLFCRKHRDRLPLDKRCLLSARHVALRVAAPARYYDKDRTLWEECLSQARASLDRLGSIEPGLEMRELSMSLDVLAFPDWFDSLPFTNGEQVRQYCDEWQLTDAGRRILNAVKGLAPVGHGETAQS